MRKSIILYINGQRQEITGEQVFMTVAEYLRYQKSLTGTKIVCSEGDCGACSILLSRMVDGELTEYQTINSCITFIYLLDRCHVITVEGVGSTEHLNPVQEAMVECQGSQCGYCTPGIIVAMTSMTEDLKKQDRKPTEQKIKNYLSGNLCRCTGYEPIIAAGMKTDMSAVKSLASFYNDGEIEKELLKLEEEVLVRNNHLEVYLPETLQAATEYQARNSDVTIISGGTDLGVVANKGRIKLTQLMSLNNITDAYKILDTDSELRIGSKASLTAVEKACEKDFKELSRMIHIFASPQIKNKGTLAGNLVNASPISDTVPFLRVAEAEVELVSIRGARAVNINTFIKGGYKELDIEDGELVSAITLPKTDHHFKLYKVSIRRDLDISTVTFACRYKLEGNKISDISVAMGGVGPIVLRLPKLEKMALGMEVNAFNFKKLAASVRDEISPLSDHRGTADFRITLCGNLLLRFCDEVMQEFSLGFTEASL